MFAQTKGIETAGIVLDSLSQQALPNANIRLTTISGSPVSTAFSNTKGLFDLKLIPSGEYFIDVEYIGYKSVHQQIKIPVEQKSFVELKIFLSLAEMKLGEVVISGKVLKPFIIYNSGKIILNVSDNPLTAGDDVFSVLLRAPGVVDLNGTLIFRNKSVNVLINGKPTHLSGEELKNTLSSMPANSVDKIEILPNPSAKYDAQGGSVINIVLAKGKNNGLNGIITSGIGSGKYLKYSEDITLNYRSGKTNVYGSYDLIHNKQYYESEIDRIVNSSTSITQTNYELRNRHNNSYKIGIDYDLNKTSTISVLFRGYTNFGQRFVTNGSRIIHQQIGDSTSTGLTNGDVKLTSPSLGIGYTNKIDSTGKEFSISVDYLNYKKNWKDVFSTDYFDNNGIQYLPTSLLRDNLPGEVTNYTFAIDYVQPLTIGKLEYGLKSQITKTENNLLFEENTGNIWVNNLNRSNDFVYNENINAAYLNYSKTFNIKYILSLGLRGEQTNTLGNLVTNAFVTRKKYFNIFPNVNFTYLAGINSEINFNYRKSIDRFGLNIVNPFLIYQSQFAYSQGNPNIQPQINHNLELTYTYKKTFVFGSSYTRTVDPLAPVFVKGENNSIISTFNNLKAADLFYVYFDLSFPIFKFWKTDLTGGTGFLKYNTSSSLYIGNNSTWSYLMQAENIFSLGDGWNVELNVLQRGPYASGTYKIKSIFSSSTGISKDFYHNRAAFKLALLDIFNTDKQRISIQYQDVILGQINKAETRYLNFTCSYKFGNNKIKPKQRSLPQTNDTEHRLNN
jgi:hypothetical protein